MGFQNKFGVFLVGVSLVLPPFAHALVLEPLTIDSSRGEPLYAEIPFRNAKSQTPIKVSIAQPFELGRLEVLDSNQFAHLNFYVRQNSQGHGVIVITSSRALTESAIDLTLKIEDAGQVRMQNINTKLPSRIERLQSNLKETVLKPRIVANEEDIKLNLPESSTLSSQSTSQKNNQQLVIQSSAPPPLSNQVEPFVVPRIANISNQENNTQHLLASEHIKSTAPLRVTSPLVLEKQERTQPTTIKSAPPAEQESTVVTQNIPIPAQNVTPIEPSNLTINVSRRLATNPAPIIVASPTQQNIIPSKEQAHTPKTTGLAQDKSATSPPVASTEDQAQQHIVQANESLWGIAQQIAKSQNISTQQVMQQIQQNNPAAFIGGKANRLKQGAILNIPSTYQVLATAKTSTSNTDVTIKVPKETHSPQQPTASKQTQAHLSIVGNTNQGTAQGSQEKSIGDSKAQNELTLQLKNQRGSALSLQNNVKKLDQQLREKERRISLLNARLAELEEQLKNRKANSENTSPNTTSRSQGVIPALITCTIIAFAGLNSDFAIASLLQELV